MNERLRQTLNKLRGVELGGPEELANFLQREGVHFSGDDLSSWGWFLTSRFGRYASTFQVPEWLAAVFRSLIEDRSRNIICDPWAGIGFLIGFLRETPGVKESFALTQNQSELELGKTLVPEAIWQIGDTLNLVSELDKQVDVVASILPMGLRSSHPFTVSGPSGDKMELKDDHGNLLLVAASLKLADDGLGLFVVTPSFFFSHRSVLRQFGVLGLGIEAALALPSGTFAPLTNIAAYLIIVRRKPTTTMFVAQLSADTNTNNQNHRQLQAGSRRRHLKAWPVR